MIGSSWAVTEFNISSLRHRLHSEWQRAKHMGKQQKGQEKYVHTGTVFLINVFIQPFWQLPDTWTNKRKESVYKRGLLVTEVSVYYCCWLLLHCKLKKKERFRMIFVKRSRIYTFPKNNCTNLLSKTAYCETQFSFLLKSFWRFYKLWGPFTHTKTKDSYLRYGNVNWYRRAVSHPLPFVQPYAKTYQSAHDMIYSAIIKVNIFQLTHYYTSWTLKTI